MNHRTRKIAALILAAPIALPFIFVGTVIGLLWLGLRSWGRIVALMATESPAPPPSPELRPDPPVDPRISPPSRTTV